MQRKDPKQALADFDEAIRLSPEEPLLYLHRADARAALLEWAQALADSRRAVHFATPPAAKAAQAAEDARGNATPSAPTPESTVLAACCNNLAWILATAPDPKIRNGREAVTVATRACKALDWKAGETMDTLAAAYAEAGDFDNAVKWQVKAIELKADDKSFVEISRERVALYRQRKPYHMPGG